MEAWTRLLVLFALLSIFLASQVFWLRQIGRLGKALVRNEHWRKWLAGIGVVVYLYLFAYNTAWWDNAPEPTELTLRAALLQAPYRWWVICSLLGFGMAALFGVALRAMRLARWSYRTLRSTLATLRQYAAGQRTPRQEVRPGLQSPAKLRSMDRRQFLERAAVAVSASPFLAGAYGLFQGRLNLQTTQHRINLARLPKAFHGLRIAQLSDIHIGPFMPEAEIRKYVAITNEIKPDLVVLTGDFITWDPATQKPVVEALAGLRAPLGVFGCLGNHELWYEVEDSISRLFAASGIHILRGDRVLLQSHGEVLNLIGLDFQTRRRMGPPGTPTVRRYLEGIEHVVRPDTVNVLLSHNPNTFDSATELGIDLSLSGHTHGGQVTMEFIHPSLSPGRLVTKYVKGWYGKNEAQLYVNSGIGTMFAPIRLGAPPEITLLELVRPS